MEKRMVAGRKSSLDCIWSAQESSAVRDMKPLTASARSHSMPNVGSFAPTIPPAPPLPEWCRKIQSDAGPVQPKCKLRVLSTVSFHRGAGLDEDDLYLSNPSVLHPEDEDDIYGMNELPLSIMSPLACSVCYESVSPMDDLEAVGGDYFCSHQYLCRACMRGYVRGKVADGIVKAECPAEGCTDILPADTVRAYIDPNGIDRFERLLTIKDTSGTVHLCPNCSTITHAPEKRHRRKGSHVTCTDCSFDWCFECEAPWHPKSTCKEARKSGSKDFRGWLKTRVSRDTPNAQRCPKCKIPIQRSSGCNNMTCSKCHTSFCYRCGSQQRDVVFLGSHYSRYSVLGCKYNFKPDQPVKRKAIRGSLLVTGITVGVPVCIGGGAVVLALVLAASPFYGTYKILKNVKEHI
eukprot:scpid62298/ scgid17648/ Probable E3 ubiquitin-protein ligase RNF217; IBR domain-containing protein 1; RING finger protein 217